MIRISALESRTLEFRSQPCRVLALSPGEISFASLSLSFLIREMETTILLISSSHCEDSQLIQIAWDLVSAQDLILTEVR